MFWFKKKSPKTKLPVAGYHYVMSDIHGQYDDYMQLLNQIQLKENDTLYILGDAIDRGPKPIDVLQDIKTRPNVIFLIGNHEHMMIQSLLYNDNDQLYSWTLNGAETTRKQWDELSEKEQQELLSWLNEQLLAIPNLYVNGRNYYLAHATHFPYVERRNLKYNEVDADKSDAFVWNRAYQNPNTKVLAKAYGKIYKAYPNTTLIIGHTPIYRCSYGQRNPDGSCLISRGCSGHLMNIDCGGAKGLPLGCIRLEDGKEFYAKREERP